MTSKLLGLLTLSLILFAPAFLRADPPVVSANGFTCTKSQLMVTCQGQFPAMTGVSSASGTYGVQLSYETLNAPRKRLIFDSTNGCLMQINVTPDGNPTQALVKNASGRAQTFSLPAQQTQAFGFCKSLG